MKPKLRMVEIYRGKIPEWKGRYNLTIDIDGNAGNSKAIAGPIDPETSKQILLSMGIDL